MFNKWRVKSKFKTAAGSYYRFKFKLIINIPAEFRMVLLN
jgi:hypothetical protein